MAIRPVCGIPEPVSKSVMKLTPRLGVRARRDATLSLARTSPVGPQAPRVSEQVKRRRQGPSAELRRIEDGSHLRAQVVRREGLAQELDTVV